VNPSLETPGVLSSTDLEQSFVALADTVKYNYKKNGLPDGCTTEVIVNNTTLFQSIMGAKRFKVQGVKSFGAVRTMNWFVKNANTMGNIRYYQEQTLRPLLDGSFSAEDVDLIVSNVNQCNGVDEWKTQSPLSKAATRGEFRDKVTDYNRALQALNRQLFQTFPISWNKVLCHCNEDSDTYSWSRF